MSEAESIIDDAEPSSESPPDPSEVEPLGQADGVYQRDEDGELRPLPPEVVKWNGKWHRVRFYPVPIGQFGQYEELGEDVDMETLCGILADKVHTPRRSEGEWQDTEPEQFMAVMQKLVETATGEVPSTDFHKEVRQELEQRDGGPGN